MWVGQVPHRRRRWALNFVVYPLIPANPPTRVVKKPFKPAVPRRWRKS